VEITTIEQNVERRTKRNEDSLRDLWDNIKHTNTRIIGVPEGEERERTWENIWRDNSWKLNLLHMGKEIAKSRKDKPKEKHTETHSNQTDKN